MTCNFCHVHFRRGTGSLTAKDREVLSLRRQLDSTSEELTETSRAREVALRENRRLQDDLATMTRENQVHTSASSLHIGFLKGPEISEAHEKVLEFENCFKSAGNLSNFEKGH